MNLKCQQVMEENNAKMEEDEVYGDYTWWDSLKR